MNPASRLSETHKAILSHIRRTGGSGAHGLYKRSLQLIDRYDDIKAALVGSEGLSNSVWREHCERIGADPTHNGYDLFC